MSEWPICQRLCVGLSPCPPSRYGYSLSLAKPTLVFSRFKIQNPPRADPDTHRSCSALLCSLLEPSASSPRNPARSSIEKSSVRVGRRRRAQERGESIRSRPALVASSPPSLLLLFLSLCSRPCSLLFSSCSPQFRGQGGGKVAASLELQKGREVRFKLEACFGVSVRSRLCGEMHCFGVGISRF
jgi:hypothetical protein